MIIPDKRMIPHVQRVLDGEYDIPGLELGDNPTIIDIGGNYGAFIEWALKRFPGAQIISYEPHPETFKTLVQNFGEHPKVTLINAAVYVGTDKIMLCEGVNNVGEATIYGKVGSKEYAVDVVDAATLPPCDFLKLDCEGAESIILSNYKHIDTLKGIALECHSKKDAVECAKHLGDEIEEPKTEIGIMKKAFVELKFTLPKIFVAVPVHYQPTTRFMMSLMALKLKYPSIHIQINNGDAHPDRARNALCNQFMDGDCDYLFFLDADLSFEIKAVSRLFEMIKDRTRKVVNGFYCKKSPDSVTWVGNQADDNLDSDGFYHMREAATGALIIHRDVFLKMQECYPEKYHIEDETDKPRYAYFESGVKYDTHAKRRRWLSEDWYFSQQVVDMGYTIYGNPDAVFMHEGSCLFPILKKDNDE